jgi:hypothetical protein
LVISPEPSIFDALYDRFMVGERGCSEGIGDMLADLVVVVLDRFRNDVLEDAIGAGDGVLALDKLAGGGGFKSGLLIDG